MKINDMESITNLEYSNNNSSFSLLSDQVNTQEAYSQLNQQLDAQELQKKTVLEARNILGDPADKLSDEQIIDLVNELQFLVDSWLEEFERKSFNGKTLNELIAL